MVDPLSNIEEKQDQIDIGTLYYRVYLGAREAGGTRLDAVLVIMGLFLAVLRNTQLDTEGGEDESQQSQ
jgi:hypothetical protein